ncbi:hypothetical protein [Pseudomonas libanensis]|uniref:hypothetical protein n=1 Tax=Pseudomonas libanensis TaxID=75588 RepID=UPI0012E3898C|nr:hypothetical protein [Pseudomonas libanensis]
MADPICPALLNYKKVMMFSPGIIGQVAWFILIHKRRVRADICTPAAQDPADGVFMPSRHFGNEVGGLDPSTRPLAIVHFARATPGHRAGCEAIDLCGVFNYLILLSFILQ